MVFCPVPTSQQQPRALPFPPRSLQAASAPAPGMPGAENAMQRCWLWLQSITRALDSTWEAVLSLEPLESPMASGGALLRALHSSIPAQLRNAASREQGWVLDVSSHCRSFNRSSIPSKPFASKTHGAGSAPLNPGDTQGHTKWDILPPRLLGHHWCTKTKGLLLNPAPRHTWRSARKAAKLWSSVFKCLEDDSLLASEEGSGSPVLGDSEGHWWGHHRGPLCSSGCS